VGRNWLSIPIPGTRIRVGRSMSDAEIFGTAQKREALPSLPDEQQAPAAEAPAAEDHPWARIEAWVIFGFAIWGFISMVGCMLAHAGTCRIYGDGTDTVEACEDGSFIVTDRDGHKRQYGEPNAGFERYPGQGERPVFERRDER
jgi:hypothetical protein